MSAFDAVGKRLLCPLCGRASGLTPRGRWARHGPRRAPCRASGLRVAETARLAREEAGDRPPHDWAPDPAAGQGRRRCVRCGAPGWRETRSGEVLELAAPRPPTRASAPPPPRAAPEARSARLPSLDDYDRE